MRFLLLALPVFAFLPQVIPAYSGGKKCGNKLGYCRTRCKNGEAQKELCKKHLVCCIPAEDINQELNRQVSVTTTPTWNAGSLDPIDVIVTIAPSEDYEAGAGPNRNPNTQTPAIDFHLTVTSSQPKGLSHMNKALKTPCDPSSAPRRCNSK